MLSGSSDVAWSLMEHEGVPVLDLTVPVPDVPVLGGLSVHMQNGVVSPAGKQWLTNAIAPVFF